MAAQRIDKDNPWPWLDPFTENDVDFFNGRDDDAAAFERRVLSGPAAVLFGKSGLGKTSLLQAGLFPRLRRLHLMPVLVRLNHDADAPPAPDQMYARLVEECAAHRLTPPGEATLVPPSAALAEPLWRALHTPPLAARDAEGSAWQPIFVLDQFEEIFTLGAQNAERQRHHFGSLGDLIENRIPAAVEAAIGADEDLLDRLQLDAQPYRIILSLREDYLPDLERWCDLIPRLGPNRYRLLPMREEQALAATLQTGGRLVTPDDAERIVCFVASQQDGTLAAIDAPLPRAPQIEPALLSLVCSGLNAERQANGAAQIDASNLDQLGGRIIERFYDDALAGIAPELTAFVENDLITPDGIRLTYPLKSILQRPGIGKTDLDKLIDRRLLRKEAFVDSDRIEVVHDRLAAVALQRRHNRERAAAEQRLREEAERAEVLAQEQQKRAEAEAAARRQAEESGAHLKRMQRWLWGALAGLVVLLGVAVWAAWNAYQQTGIAQRQTEVAEERQREALAQKASADAATRNAEEQRQIADERRAEVEEKQSQLLTEQRKTEAALTQARSESEKARQANRQAETNLGQAKAAEDRALASLREATILRLAAEGPMITRGSWAGGSLRGLLTVLAAHRLSDPDNPRTAAAAFGAMQGEDLRFSRMNSLREHSGAVFSVAFSPDGRRIVSGSWDGTLRRWDATTGLPISKPLKGHTTGVVSVAFSPDGRRIISGSDDRTVRLWDAATGAPIGEPPKEHTHTELTKKLAELFFSVAFSPDGERIVSGSWDGTLRLWDAATGLPIGEPIGKPLKGHATGVFGVAFSPDGRRIVSGSANGTLRLWDAATGAPIGEPLKGHTGGVVSVAFSPDGRRFISGSWDKTLRLWDGATGVPIGEPLKGHTGGVVSVAFSPDGRRIVSGSDNGTLCLWDAATGAPIGEPLKGHTGGVSSVAFSPDGRRIVSGSDDETLRLWDGATGVPIGEPLKGHTKGVFGVAFSPDGRRIVSGSADDTLRLWDATTGKPLIGVSSVAFSPDGRCIVSGSINGILRLWDAATGAPIGEPLKGHTQWVSSVAFSPDGRRFISGSWDKTLRLWDGATGVLIGEPLKGHTGWVQSVAFSPDGRRIVSGSDDHTLRLWDGATGVPIGEPLKGHTKGVFGVAFSPDGRRIVSGSGDHTLRLWDAATGEPIGEPLKGHTKGVFGVAFNPDGRHIVSGSGDHTLRLWDGATGVPIGEPLRGHTKGVFGVAFSPDGRRIVSGGDDNTLRDWPVLESWADALCAKLARNMSRKEWKAWVGADIKYACQCPGLPVPPDDDPLSIHPAALCPTPYQSQPVATVTTRRVP